jgi:hypothetical protein
MTGIEVVAVLEMCERASSHERRLTALERFATLSGKMPQ